MKINTELKYKDLPKYVRDHLMFIDTSNSKSMAIATTFFFLDLFLIVPLLYPMEELILYLTVPFIVLIHIWATRLFFKNPYSTQFEMILYLGSFGMVGSYCYYIIAQKVAYYYVGITSINYYILSTILFVLIIITLIMYQIKRYSDVKENIKEKRKTPVTI